MLRKTLVFTILSCFAFYAIGQEVISSKSKPVYISIGNATTASAKPMLTWVTPKEETTEIEVKRGSIKVGINSSVKLKNVTLYINGYPSMSDRGFGITAKEDAKFDQVLEKEIILEEGENIVKVEAVDMEGNKTVESRVIIVEVPAYASRTDYALIVGTDNYETWDDLFNPVNDAKTIEQELRENYGFKTELLTDPTKKELFTTLREYARKSYGEKDQLFIFIAGHGQFDPFFNQGYLVTTDSDIADEEKLSYISHSNLRNIVDNIPCEHIFLTMDACFGGTFDPTIAKAGHRGGDMYGDITKDEFIERKLRHKTRMFLTSGGKEYVPDGRPGGHSPFARKLLSALRSYGGSNGILTIGEIKIHVETITPEPRLGEFGSNEPGSDFVFEAR